MSDVPQPANWFNASGGASAPEEVTGAWDLDITVNRGTAITVANLPYFSESKAVQGTKPARESLIKLITGMNNDVNPLGFRGPYEGDRVTKDVYYPFAPGWSTLSRGLHPHITLPPETIVDYLIRAADCVPLIRSVPIFVINDDGSKEQVSCDALKLMNIQVKPVPNLHVKAPAPAAARTTGPSPHEIEQQRLLDRQRLELERMREEISVLKDHVAARDAAAAASSSASATPLEAPAAKRPRRGGQ